MKALLFGRLTLALFIALQSATQALAVSCDMGVIQRFQAKQDDGGLHRIRASTAGTPAIYYRANLDVNTDGAARSYHPMDPNGDNLALNNMGNAIISIFDKEGRNITCHPRQGACYSKFIRTFEAARDAGYDPHGHPSIITSRGSDIIIPTKLDPTGRFRVPCTIQSGPFAGYFVSATGFALRPNKDECDQDRYLDSLSVNAVVIPKSTQWASQGTVTDGTDIVLTRNTETGKIVFAINGDRGPPTNIGEGTVILAARLGAKTLTGKETYHDVLRLKLPDVQYLIFPRADIIRIVGPNFTQADLDREGERLFQEWGGVARLDACKASGQ